MEIEKEVESFLKEHLSNLFGRPVLVAYQSVNHLAALNHLDNNCIWVEFRSSANNTFFLGMKASLFRFLYDGQLGFDSPLTSDSFSCEEPLTELEMKSSLLFLDTFAAISFLFPMVGPSIFQAVNIINVHKKYEVHDIYNVTNGENIPNDDSSNQSNQYELLKFVLSEEGKELNQVLYLAVEESLWTGTVSSNSFDSNNSKPNNKECTLTTQNQENIEIKIRVGEARVRLEELAALQVGDTLQTNIPANSLFWVDIDGRPMFRGRPGLFEGTMSIQLEK